MAVCSLSQHLVRNRRITIQEDRQRCYFGAGAIRVVCLGSGLLHKSGFLRTSPFPDEHPTVSVTGMPRAVKAFRTATRTWNSAT
jgi:hypothetical protein